MAVMKQTKVARAASKPAAPLHEIVQEYFASLPKNLNTSADEKVLDEDIVSITVTSQHTGPRAEMKVSPSLRDI